MSSNLIDNNLNIITWNARGIRKKHVEFINFLNTNNIDIALVTETWLTSEIRISTPAFKCYRIDRSDRRGGGVAILIRRSIQHELLRSVQTRYVENLGVEVRLRNGNTIKNCLCIFSR